MHSSFATRSLTWYSPTAVGYALYPGIAEILSERGHRLFPEFAERIRTMPQGTMLEIGSRARSGVIRRGVAPPGWEYVGLDIVPGPNVDVVGDAHELSASCRRTLLMQRCRYRSSSTWRCRGRS
jgi:hypothetical protein